MIKLNILDWNCADLIHSYVEEFFDDFCVANEGDDVSELDFVLARRSMFKEWAELYGYDIDIKTD